MAKRVHFQGSFQERDNNLSLLTQASGEQGVTVVTSRSGMLVTAGQILTQPKGDL